MQSIQNKFVWCAYGVSTDDNWVHFTSHFIYFSLALPTAPFFCCLFFLFFSDVIGFILEHTLGRASPYTMTTVKWMCVLHMCVCVHISMLDRFDGNDDTRFAYRITMIFMAMWTQARTKYWRRCRPMPVANQSIRIHPSIRDCKAHAWAKGRQTVFVVRNRNKHAKLYRAKWKQMKQIVSRNLNYYYCYHEYGVLCVDRGDRHDMPCEFRKRNKSGTEQTQTCRYVRRSRVNYHTTQVGVVVQL